MRQLPASLSVDADPTNLVKSLKDEQGDLVAPVQQKLLKRILSEVTPKGEKKILFVTQHVFFTTRPNEDGTTYQAFLLL